MPFESVADWAVSRIKTTAGQTGLAVTMGAVRHPAPERAPCATRGAILPTVQEAAYVEPEFNLEKGLIYLNHAAVAPWPKRAGEAVMRFAQENMTQGAKQYPRWLALESELRALLATLINAPSPDDIALLKNTSEGLSLVAYGLDWRPGDNILSFAGEFPSNRIVWESLADQGVELRLVPLEGSRDPEADLLSRCDGSTRLVAVSSVQYANGMRIDLHRIGDYCRANDILFCVDAIQSLGALPFDTQAVRADFVAADGHKWLLGPEGLAVFYCRPEIREQLKLRQFGWHMVEHAGDYDRKDWSPASTARRFECGSPNMLGIHALHASVSLLLESGIANVAERLLSNTDYLIERVEAMGFVLLSPSAPSRRSGIVTFAVPGTDPADADSDNDGLPCRPWGRQRGPGRRHSFLAPLPYSEGTPEAGDGSAAGIAI